MAKAGARSVKEYNFVWEGKNRDGRLVRGEMKASSPTVVKTSLRRQNILLTKISKGKAGGRAKKITDKDITLFTRQLSTMMRSGVPLLQSFDIVGKGHANPSVGKLLLDIKAEVETGSSLSAAFRKYPDYFDPLFCNLVGAGEQGGILDQLLDRLATYKEKMLAIKSKIKSALTYPIAIIAVSFIVTGVIMVYVVPSFKSVFKGFGADLPAPTLIVIAISDFFVAYWWLMLGALVGSIYLFMQAYKKSENLQITVDRLLLRAPVFGDIIRKAVMARWTRTLSTMFAAGVPLVEALDSVGGSAGNHIYRIATKKIQAEVSTGTSLTVAMQDTDLFPNMVTQMVAIGEESGALDSMLTKVADFFDQEVDDAVESMSSLMEPLIMAFLGVVIGGLVVAMYLPIFKMGSIV